MYLMRDKGTSDVENVWQPQFALRAKKLIVNAEAVHILLNQLVALELAIQEIEKCLDSVYRCLLKTRVSLLNVLGH